MSLRSYNDLLEEKRRLEALLQSQKELIKQDFEMLRRDVRPMQQALSTAGKITSATSDNPLLRLGLGIATDVLVGSTLIAGGGWLTRLVAPFVVKNVSNFILNKKSGSTRSFLSKLLHR